MLPWPSFPGFIHITLAYLASFSLHVNLWEGWDVCNLWASSSELACCLKVAMTTGEIKSSL